jgi:glycosyltransferase involved in cell wall biosynthesis
MEEGTLGMHIVHLTASTFYGGPERQMLGLARHLPDSLHSSFLSFAEEGRCRAFVGMARHHGFEAHALRNDTPHLWAAAREIAEHLRRLEADVLCCHGYKANLVGRVAARNRRIPAVAVARGWTGESLKVRLYEAVDRFHLRWMDRVVCVSESQAEKVRRAGVRPPRIHVAHNAIDPDRFPDPDARYRTKLQRYFRQPRTRIVGAAGRLSPEKGFEVLVAAAERVHRVDRSVGFVLFGEGPCRSKLAKQIHAAGLSGAFALSGFRGDLDRFIPFFDLLALPSYSEGLPNVVLEAFAAGVPVVATAAGGTPEIVEEGVSGHLVKPGDAAALADRILAAMASEDKLRDMGLMGRQRILERFTFRAQAARYVQLFNELVPVATGRAPSWDEVTTAGASPQTAGQPMPSDNEDLVSRVHACEP